MYNFWKISRFNEIVGLKNFSKKKNQFAKIKKKKIFFEKL